MSEPDATATKTGPARLRRLVRGISMTVAIVLLWPGRQTGGAAAVPGLSPFVALGSVLAMRALHGVALLGLVVGCIVLIHRRWFCRWLCPLGLCVEQVSRLGRRWGRRPLKSMRPGQWILWLTLGGALLGWPLLLWLDPMVVFAALFTPTTPLDTPVGWVSALPALIVLVLSLIRPYAWCTGVCPLGALQEILSRLGKPVGRLIRPRKYTPQKPASGLPLARRAVLGAGIGAISATALRITGKPRVRPLRPPGAAAESSFLGSCVRCGNCVRACPTRIIKPDLGRYGAMSLLTPVLRFEGGYCREDCTACTRVCPSAALKRLAVDDKARAPLGLPTVDMSVCLLGDERECSECKRWCPHEAIRYVFSEVEYTLVPVIDGVKCTGCGACEMACPVKPKKASVVAPLPN